MNRLEQALSRLLNRSELTGRLTRVLTYASKKGRLSYYEVERMVKDNTEDVLLLGNEWRLLLPVRTLKSATWEDRLLVAKPEELYEVPNIVRYLVEDAGKTGRWVRINPLTRELRDVLTGACGLIDTTIFHFAEPPIYTIRWSILYLATYAFHNNHEV